MQGVLQLDWQCCREPRRFLGNPGERQNSGGGGGGVTVSRGYSSKILGMSELGGERGTVDEDTRRALFNLCLSFTHSHTHSHTNGDWLPCNVPTSSSGAIGG